MSSDLERRLEGLLAAAPEPEPGVGEEALARALSALRPTPRARRGLRTAVLVFAAILVLLAVAAGSLAAAGALHVSIGAKPKQPPRPSITTTQLSLPKDANGIAAIVDGRLSVVTSGGFRLQGLPVSSAAISPHAKFVAAGIGRSLVAIRPNGSRAWSHPAGGTVVDIAWAPDGLQIAYIVHAGRRFVLHTIYGNGIHDSTLDRSVRAVRPSWRTDSLAFAYVGAGGKAIVYDLGHEKHHVVARSKAVGSVTQLAFAPKGGSLALAGSRGFATTGRCVHPAPTQKSVAWIGWVGSSLLVAGGGRHTTFDWLACGSSGLTTARLGGKVLAFDAYGRRVAVALAGNDVRLIVVGKSLRHMRTVGLLPRGTRVTTLAVD